MINRAHACAVPASAWMVVPEADFADAYQIDFAGRHTSMELVRSVFSNPPFWFGPLLKLRHLLVKPLGLHTAAPRPKAGGEVIGLFPVQMETPGRVVLGFDDRHLDFRLVADAEALGVDATRLVISTVIRRHNWLGRIYLGVVMPFHRIIVPAYMNGGSQRFDGAQ